MVVRKCSRALLQTIGIVEIDSEGERVSARVSRARASSSSSVALVERATEKESSARPPRRRLGAAERDRRDEHAVAAERDRRDRAELLGGRRARDAHEHGRLAVRELVRREHRVLALVAELATRNERGQGDALAGREQVAGFDVPPVGRLRRCLRRARARAALQQRQYVFRS